MIRGSAGSLIFILGGGGGGGVGWWWGGGGGGGGGGVVVVEGHASFGSEPQQICDAHVKLLMSWWYRVRAPVCI